MDSVPEDSQIYYYVVNSHIANLTYTWLLFVDKFQ